MRPRLDILGWDDIISEGQSVKRLTKLLPDRLATKIVRLWESGLADEKTESSQLPKGHCNHEAEQLRVNRRDRKTLYLALTTTTPPFITQRILLITTSMSASGSPSTATMSA